MARRHGRSQERTPPSGAGRTPEAGERRRGLRIALAVICAILAIAILAIYAQTFHYDYVAYDDDEFIVDNAHVRAGLTPASAEWAVTTSYSSYWHPLTWLSYELDNQLFGLNAGPEHAVNVLLHLASTLLLFFALRWMTRRTWLSAIVAGVFALHPLHVESVAWIAERKDVLSTFFAMLLLLLYVRYAKAPSAGRYLQVAAVFGLALMAKPMVVTLPFVLLLLDFWPLGRIEWPLAWPKLARPILEKLPLLAMAAVVSTITYVVQKKNGAMAESIPLTERLGNALVSYVRYLGKTFWPANLAVLYPLHSEGALAVAASALVLAAITIVVVLRARRSPWLAVGWFWFVGTLVPVIGVVQVGSQAIADRYTYVPMIGLSIAVVWGVAEAVLARPRWEKAAGAAGGLALLVLAAMAYRQAEYWKNSFTLFEHALAVTRDNYIMQNNMGIVVGREGRSREAMDYFREAIALHPAYAGAYAHLGRELLKSGATHEATVPLERAVALDPGMEEAQADVGIALAAQGRLDEAKQHLEQAVLMKPEDAESQSNLCSVLQYLGRPAEGVAHCQEAVKLRPDSAASQLNLASALAAEGKRDDAIREARALLEKHPDYGPALAALDDWQRAEPH